MIPRSRFQLNVTAGSQKRAIANLRKSEGRDESRFALRLKRNLDFNCKSRSLSIFCHYLDKSCHYLDNQNVWAFSRCVENDSKGMTTGGKWRAWTAIVHLLPSHCHCDKASTRRTVKISKSSRLIACGRDTLRPLIVLRAA